MHRFLWLLDATDLLLQSVFSVQIGSQGGYLNKPINLTSLFLGVAERYDIIIDFATVPEDCADIIVTNNYPQPFPDEARRPDNNTGTVMKIHLTKRPTEPFRIPDLPNVSTVQSCTGLYSTVLYSTVLYSPIQYSTVLSHTVQLRCRLAASAQAEPLVCGGSTEHNHCTCT